MKDMKMKVKLTISFVLVAVLTLAAGLVGVFEVRSMSKNESAVYLYARGTNGVTELQRNIQAQRAAFRGAAMLSLNDMDPGDEFTKLDALDAEFRSGIAVLLEGVDDAGMYNTLTQINALYTGTYYPMVQQIVSGIRTGSDDAAVTQIFYDLHDPLADLQSSLEGVTQEAMRIMGDTVERDTSSAGRLAVVLLVLALLAVGLALFFAFYISHIIAAPLERMAREVRKLSTGNFNVCPDINQDDEIGEVDKALWHIVKTMMEQQEGISRMAAGDFTVSFPVRSAEDTMNKALNTLVDNYNNIMEEIRSSATQVNAGAGQIANASQALATGSTQQATTIDLLTASLTNIQSMADTNSATASETLADFQDAVRTTEECNSAMGQMMHAMADIDEKSSSISKVIKVIDDIAFQTNILALNAAVEAARAGQHGKGFAVVADEVRNLASKSADAARETAELIQQSIRSVSEGNMIVERVGSSIREVGEIAERNQQSLDGINQASQKQKDSITEVTYGIQQLSSVIQANTANAEETAASSEEMAAQATMLEDILQRFNLKKGQQGQFASSYSETMDSDETGFALPM